jgi:hypothetical protein
MVPDEIVDLVRRLAAALPGRIEIAFDDTSLVIEPL